MTQPSLFDQGPQVLLEEASGRVVLTPCVVPATLAAAWFASLLDQVPWKEGRRLL